MAQPFGTVPTVQQDVRSRASDRLKLAYEGLHQLDLAGKRHVFGLTHFSLPVQMWSQGTASIQQQIEPLHQTMADHPFVIAPHVALAQSFPLAPFRFAPSQ